MSADYMDPARAIVAALGCELTGLRSSAWSSETFSGIRLEIETKADLPTGLDETEITLPSGFIADVAAAGPRLLEVLVIDAS